VGGGFSLSSPEGVLSPPGGEIRRSVEPHPLQSKNARVRQLTAMLPVSAPAPYRSVADNVSAGPRSPKECVQVTSIAA